MIPYLVILFIFLFSLNSSAGKEKEAFPFEYGGYWDGGTLYIKDVRTNRKKSLSVCYDGRERSQTKGKIFLGTTHPDSKGAKLATAKEVNQLFDLILVMMDEYFGKELTTQIYKLKDHDEASLFQKKHPSLSLESISYAAQVNYFITRNRPTNKKMQNKSE